MNGLSYVKVTITEFAKKYELLFKQLENSLIEKEKEQFNEILSKVDNFKKQVVKDNKKILTN